MKSLRMLPMALALALAATVGASAALAAPPAAPPSGEWPPAASLPALQVRMQAIRAEKDPGRRMALMEEQLKAFEAYGQGMPQCPMAGGPGAGRGGPPMMMDGSVTPEMMREHMQMMQQHMGMMNRMMMMQPPATPAAPAGK
ncbi:hypothetical protein [Azoarcus olearius]|uniref:Conserved hypothetical secreted protein n=1 Tax=Azoarcus sp. (strain BH72) TaxID=418699 RepID=A1K9Q8_AZOSB|nr:hypothetical protein [Azoarcus olearius]CAL95563.1 conserved hypothetical secreted protein [Azoarcus olearius]